MRSKDRCNVSHKSLDNQQLTISGDNQGMSCLRLVSLVLLIGMSISPAWANGIYGDPTSGVASPQAQCQAAIATAEQASALPAGLLGAIAIVESGRPQPGNTALAPWPWTIDAAGVGHFYPTKQAAMAAAAAFQSQGITSLDIGCLQINLQQHPNAFASLDAAFDPLSNALYAAGFLNRLHDQFADWTSAIGAYHSQTPALGQPYAAQVSAIWQHAPPPVLTARMNPPAGGPGAIAPISGLAGLLPARWPAGGFQFSSPGSHPAMIGLPAALASAGRGLAAYRARPILIAGRPAG